MKTNKKKTNKKKTNKKKTNKTRKITNINLEKINGYNVLFLRNHSDTISIQSYIFKGFIHEKKSNMGINHLLEHVLSNAYKNCDNYNCYEYLNLLGLMSNASTNHNIINYYATGLLKETKDIIDYIINITVNPIFNNDLVEKEKSAVHNELLISLDNPDQKLYNKMAKHFYNIEGLKYMDDDQLMIDNLKKLDYNYLIKYYKKNYNYNNTLFVVSGNYNKKIVKQQFKINLPYTPIKIKEKYINYKKINCFTNKSGIYHIQDKSIQSTKILFYFPTNFYINSKKLTTLNIAASILQVLLFDKLRVEEELIYNINFDTIVNTCGTIQEIFVNTRNINFLQVINEFKKTINKYKKEKFCDTYITAEKTKYLIKYNNVKFLNSTQLANKYGPQYIYNHFLNTKIQSNEEYKDCIMKVTANEIRNIINEVFDFEKCMLVYSNNENNKNITEI